MVLWRSWGSVRGVGVLVWVRRVVVVLGVLFFVFFKGVIVSRKGCLRDEVEIV